MIKAVLFDLDGVIRIWDPDLLVHSEREACLPPGAIARAAFSPDLLEPVVTGKVTDENWREQIVARLREQYPDTDAELAVRLWSESPGRVDDGVLELVHACRRSCIVLLITNATSRLRRDLDALGVIADFDHIINTSEIGYAKPDPRIYETALLQADVAPVEALFIDDSQQHAEAARAVGIRGHQYVGVGPLKTELRELGLI